MIPVVRPCRPALACLTLVSLLAGCAGNDAPPPPKQVVGAPRDVCPDGRSFTMQPDPATRQTDLFLTGTVAHRLDPVPDPNGGTLFQDADFQIRSTGADAFEALTDRSTTLRQTCSRTP